MKVSIFSLCLVFLMLVAPLQALPLYSARSARLCDNCHASPFATKKYKAWKNPALYKRKCNLSCQTCHVLPSGGGLRNASGRYFAASTLAAWGAKRRPWHDRNRGFLQWLRQRMASPSKIQKTKPQAPISESAEPIERPRQSGSFFYPQDFLSYYYPLGIEAGLKQTDFGYRFGRYPGINADPMLSVGADFRPALYGADDLVSFFPMQADVGVSFHPISHITVSSTAGLQGRASGLQDTLQDPENKPARIQNAFLLVHELPYQAYFMVGYFLPEFGTRFEDHTLFTRRPFEMDISVTGNHNVVRGFQLGLAPNYPYFSVSLFQTQDESHQITGYGYSANLLWRDLAYGGGFSLIQKYRSPDQGGDFTAISGQVYWNLWHLFPKTRYYLPVTFQSEYVVGQKPRSLQHKKLYSAFLWRVNLLLFNGFNLRLHYEFFDEDWQLKDDTLNRIGLGFDWTFYRGLRFSLTWRNLLGATGEGASDFIMFLHAYL